MSQQLNLEDEDVNITLRRGWDRAIRLLAERVNKPTWETHLRVIRPISLSEGKDNRKSFYYIQLGVPSSFTRDWVEKRHTGLITQVLEEVFDRDVRISFSLLAKEASGNAKEGTRSGRVSAADQSVPATGPAMLPLEGLLEGLEDAGAPDPTDTPAKPSARPAHARSKTSTGTTTPAPSAAPVTSDIPPASPKVVGVSGSDTTHLNARYTFQSWVTGPSNRLAHAGAQAVAAHPGQVYNPLFLYGPSGLGKTHLMHAIGHEVARTRPSGECRVAYVSGEAFTSHFITSLREHKSEEFRRRWRSVDLWLVDDIQFIVGKERTNEEFFHTFNALYQMGKQIVISSDRSPRELQAMDERLRSRFESGLIADVAPADLETRLAILHKKADAEWARVPDDVLLYIAKTVQSNIRTLEGALVKLIASASLQNVPPTIALAEQTLQYYIQSTFPGGASGAATAPLWDNAAQVAADTFAATAPVIRPGNRWGGGGMSSDSARFPSGRSVTPELVQTIVARWFNMDPSQLTGKKRDREIVNARQIAMHLTREMTDVSLPGIGQLYGGRDHTTVLHACDRVRGQIPTDDNLARLLDDLALQIRSQAAG